MTQLRVLTVVLLSNAIISLPIFAEDTKPKAPAKKGTKPSPKQTVATFYRYLAADELSKAKELLFMPINNPRVASRVDEILKLLATQHKRNGKVHVFDNHILDDLAVVVYGTEGRRFIDNIDIDPLFLRQKDGHWKLVLANSASSLKEHELPTEELKAAADRLIKWYDEREASVRAEWRKRNKDKK